MPPGPTWRTHSSLPVSPRPAGAPQGPPTGAGGPGAGSESAADGPTPSQFRVTQVGNLKFQSESSLWKRIGAPDLPQLSAGHGDRDSDSEHLESYTPGQDRAK